MATELSAEQGAAEWVWAMTAVSSSCALSPDAARAIFEWAIMLEEIIVRAGHGPGLYNAIFGPLDPKEE